jgi:hypothetical protein
MNRSSFAIALSLVLSSAACTLAPVSPKDLLEPLNDAGPAPSATDAGSPPEAPAAALEFKPSNFDLTGIDVSKLGDVVVSADCRLSVSARPDFCGARSGTFAYKLVEQPGGGKLGVFFAKNIRVEPNAAIKMGGESAIALVALDTFDIRGNIDASVATHQSSPGGFSGSLDDSSAPSNGRGPGAGRAGTTASGAGGGGFCGAGGVGGTNNGSPGSLGGKPSGNAELVPLVGGSSGGSGTMDSGSGGGAIQLVAGKKLVVATSGSVGANGGGGWSSGVVNTQPGAGGGSGGAILIESKVVEMAGTLSANGGAGGGNTSNYVGKNGQDGKTGDAPAVCEYTSESSAGGAGAAGATANGGEGIAVAQYPGTGGGGGAGRIRINADTAEVSGVVSPQVGPCAVQGSLKK